MVAEIQVRGRIVSGIALIEDHADYNHGGDTLQLGNEWTVVPGVTGDGEAADQHIFEPANNASDAIRQLFSTTDNLLECSPATVAVHYHALLETMGADGFDEDLGGRVVIMPEFIYIQAGEQESPSRELIPQVNAASPAELIAGDWVYFMNYPEYEKLNEIFEEQVKLPGPFEGENAIYLGNGRYKGFGVAETTFDGMVNKLKEAYNALVDRYEKEILSESKGKKKRSAFKKKVAREHKGETLDGSVPGVAKNSVRRVMANADLKGQAGGVRVFEKRLAEILARLNTGVPSAAHQLWKTLNADFRDAVKEAVMANKLKYHNIFKHIFPRQYHQYHAPKYSAVGPVGRSR